MKKTLVDTASEAFCLGALAALGILCCYLEACLDDVDAHVKAGSLTAISTVREIKDK